MRRAGDIRIGISGWLYPPWRGKFYPQGLAHRRELEHASRIFRTIEINGTHYSLQRPESFAAWAEATPDDFVFAVKGPRFITHMLKLKGADAALANFFASGLLRLGPKLGPILWQFPERFRFDAARFAEFFANLPHDSERAAALAKRHNEKVNGRMWLKTDAKRRIRHAVEIRSETFRTLDFIRLLRKFHVGLVVADTVDWPCLMDVTADFVYCRLHGSKELYASGYGSKSLDRWAHRVVAWSEGKEPPDATRVIPRPAPKRAARDVFVYFDNDAKVRAPFDAQTMAKKVEGIRQATT